MVIYRLAFKWMKVIKKYGETLVKQAPTNPKRLPNMKKIFLRIS